MRAGPPLITNNPDTPGDGRWEFNLPITPEQSRDQRTFEAPLLEINCGLGECTQLKFEVPWVVLHRCDNGTADGLGIPKSAVKYRFRDEDRHGMSMSIYPQFEFNNPTSSDERGLIDDGVRLKLPVQITRSAGSFELYLEAGYEFVQAGEDVELNYLPQGETLSEPFEIAKGVIIPVGEYDFDRYRITVRSSTTRPWRLGARIWFGDFFDGTLTTVETLASLTTMDSRLQRSLESELNFADLPHGKFDRRLWKFRAGCDFSPDLRLCSFIQYDNDSNLLGANTRFRWIITLGRDLFLVWNHGLAQHQGEDFALSRLESTFSELSIKLRWTFRP